MGGSPWPRIQDLWEPSRMLSTGIPDPSSFQAIMLGSRNVVQGDGTWLTRPAG